jgi:hypothetical protein
MLVAQIRLREGMFRLVVRKLTAVILTLLRIKLFCTVKVKSVPHREHSALPSERPSANAAEDNDGYLN